MKKIGLLVLAVSFGFTSPATASGLSKPVLIGQKAIGMGGAFVAVADDPTAVFHNPAGITQMEGHNFYLGMDALLTQADYTPSAPAGSPTESAKREFLPVPVFSYVTNIAEPVSFGLGFFFPHGNGGKFTTSSANPVNPDEGRIYTMEFVPTIGWKIHEQFRLGAGVRIVRGKETLDNQFIGGSLGLDTIDTLDVSGWGVGASFGALYKPCDRFAFGANYRSKVIVSMEGQTTLSAGGVAATATPTKVRFDQALPTLVTAGISVVPIEDLTVGLQYGFERNSEINQLSAQLVDLNASVVLPQNWEDSHTIHIGGDYNVTDAIGVRAGYAKDFNESVPDTVNNRIIGDVAAHEVSVGGSYQWSRYNFGLTWNARFGERTVPINGVTNTAPGTVDAMIQSISLGVTTNL